jgi:hypothetical protein
MYPLFSIWKKVDFGYNISIFNAPAQVLPQKVKAYFE